jgi:hypothetical protein
MPWQSRRSLALAPLLLLVGCAAPAIPPTLPASPPPTAEASPSPSRATLTITASGRIPDESPYGCLASFLIDPWPGAEDRIASWDDARFAVDLQGAGPGCPVSGPAIGGPSGLVPGRYRLRGVGSIVSDVASPGFSEMPILGTTVSCEQDLLVLPETTGIVIHITFRDGPCTIDMTIR